MKKIIICIAVILFTNICFGEYLLKQNEGTYIAVGPVINKTDGLTPLTSVGTPTATIIYPDETSTDLSTTREWTHISKGVYKYQLLGTETAQLGDGRIEFSDVATYVGFSEFYRVVGTDTYNVLVGNTSFENNQSVWYYFKCMMAMLLGRNDDSVGSTLKYNDMANSKARVTFTITNDERTSVTLDGD